MQVEPGNTTDSVTEKQTINQTGKIKQSLWNFFSSGLPSDSDLETLRIIFLINSMLFIGGIFLILLGATEFVLGDYFLGGMNFAFFLFLAGLFIYLRKTKNYHLVGQVGITIGGIFFFSLIAYGGIGKTTYLWAMTYPLIAVFFASYDRFLKMRFCSDIPSDLLWEVPTTPFPPFFPI